MKKEPVLSAVTAFVGSTLALLVAFGVHLTELQTGAIAGWVVAAYGIGLIVRSKVTPTKS